MHKTSNQLLAHLSQCVKSQNLTTIREYGIMLIYQERVMLMPKYMAGYCWDCNKDTKQKVVEAVDSVGWRVFETVFTFGMAAALPHDYKCECTRCGHINTLRRG